MGEVESLSSRCSSFLLSWFSPLLGLMPPAISWSRSKKKSLAPFSELSAVVPSSSGVQGLAREGYCGIFNSRCGPYTCSSVTNACQQPTAAATTAAATTAAATTAADATTTAAADATTTADSTVAADATTTV